MLACGGHWQWSSRSEIRPGAMRSHHDTECRAKIPGSQSSFVTTAVQREFIKMSRCKDGKSMNPALQL
eukprot:1670281-Rhodomonas_salina.2